MPTPLKYNPAYHDDWAWSLAIKGATDQDIADAFHVSRRTIIRWRKTYPSFNEACQHGKEVADAKVKRSLYERAVGFEYQEKESVIDVDPRTGEQKPVRVRTLTKKAVPDTMAQMYWLNNRCRDEFSQTQKVTLDGAVQTSPFDNLTDDELRRLAQMDEGLDASNAASITSLLHCQKLCTECCSETCVFNPQGICMAPFLTGKKPGIHDDGCTDYCPKPLDGCELVRSYSEHELRSYEEDVREYISQFTDEELMEAYELDRTTLNALAPRAAVLMRKYIDNDDSWTYHRDHAISEVVSEYKEDKDNG